MTNYLDNIKTWDDYREFIQEKAKKNILPDTATFELTPLCNFNCKMCYVHLKPEEMKLQGRLRTKEEWISLAKELKEKGTLFILLTGGEVLTRKDFREIYEELSKMGFLLTIYTNGYLVTEDFAKWLSKIPPMRIRITMYGASNETYERVTGIKNGYDKVLNSISLLKKYKLPLTLAMTCIKDNFKDEPLVREFAKKENLRIDVTGFVSKSVRGASTDAEHTRLTSEDVAENMYGDREVKRVYKLIDIYEKPTDVCRCHNRSCWISWSGKMTMCGFMNKIYTNPFETSFMEAWTKLQEKMDKIKKPEKCKNCKYAAFCRTCPGSLEAETGSPEETCDYICNKAKALYKKYSIQYLEEGGNNYEKLFKTNG